MKKLYWRPTKVSRSVLALIALLSLAGMAAVERFLQRAKQPLYAEKLAAARLARRAFDVLRAERERLGLPINAELDPMRSGLIGEAISPITSSPGHLPAKQTSINPNFAAVLVDQLHRAGVGKGDVVAVGVSGSFPALAVATYAALQTLHARPIIVASAAASQWGANVPGFSWLEMEQVLIHRRVFSFRAGAASIGGIEDRGLGMPKEGRRQLLDVIERSGAVLIKTRSFKESVDERLRYFSERAGQAAIKAYVNLGGGNASVGSSVGKRLFQPGLNRTAPSGTAGIDSVMLRFVQEGVPVIHLVNIETLAKRYGLPLQPVQMPAVGEGKIFVREQYNLWLALAVLVTILLSLYGFVRSDWGMRMVRTGQRPKGGSGRPERMV